MGTETLDKLYLEISQFTEAKTNREIALKSLVDRYGIALMHIRAGCAAPQLTAEEALDCAASIAERGRT